MRGPAQTVGIMVWVAGPDKDNFYEASMYDSNEQRGYRSLSRSRDAAVGFVLECYAQVLKARKWPALGQEKAPTPVEASSTFPVPTP